MYNYLFFALLVPHIHSKTEQSQYQTTLRKQAWSTTHIYTMSCLMFIRDVLLSFWISLFNLVTLELGRLMIANSAQCPTLSLSSITIYPIYSRRSLSCFWYVSTKITSDESRSFTPLENKTQHRISFNK